MAKTLIFLSPVGAKPLIVQWPSNQGFDIISTIRHVGLEFPDFQTEIDTNILSGLGEATFDSVNKMCEKYNNFIRSKLNEDYLKTLSKQKPSSSLLKHILEQTYSIAVKNPKSLRNATRAPEMSYGETSYETVKEVIEKLEIKESDVFCDLGSGIGQVVLQVAAITTCKLSVGIEYADSPSAYANAMDKEFQKLSSWFGKSCGQYELIQGDFLCESNRKKIQTATVIFANNLVFGEKINLALGSLFAELRDGTKIVTTRQLSRPNIIINEKNAKNLESILCNKYIVKGNGSWTATTVKYYIDEICRKSLITFLDVLKSRQDKKSKVLQAQLAAQNAEVQKTEQWQEKVHRFQNKDENNHFAKNSESSTTKSTILVNNPHVLKKNDSLDQSVLTKLERAELMLKENSTRFEAVQDEFKVLMEENRKYSLTIKELKMKLANANCEIDNFKIQLVHEREQKQILQTKLENIQVILTNNLSSQSASPAQPSRSVKNDHGSNYKKSSDSQSRQIHASIHGMCTENSKSCLCGIEFKTSVKLRRHIQYHTVPHKFACDVCDKTYVSRSLLKADYKRVHKIIKETDGMFQCTLCLEILNSHSELKAHYALSHKRDRKVDVEQIQTKLGENTGHGSSYSGKRKTTELCPFCDNMLSEFSELSIHITNVHKVI